MTANITGWFYLWCKQCSVCTRMLVLQSVCSVLWCNCTLWECSDCICPSVCVQSYWQTPHGTGKVLWGSGGEEVDIILSKCRAKSGGCLSAQNQTSFTWLLWKIDWLHPHLSYILIPQLSGKLESVPGFSILPINHISEQCSSPKVSVVHCSWSQPTVPGQNT